MPKALARDDESVIRELQNIINRLGLNDRDVAAFAGVSPPTVRDARKSGELPRHIRCRSALMNFIERNRAAKTRGDLRACG